jgi:hypothetical protein
MLKVSRSQQQGASRVYGMIIDLLCCVDEIMMEVPKYPQANVYSSEIVTLDLLFALKSAGARARPPRPMPTP